MLGTCIHKHTHTHTHTEASTCSKESIGARIIYAEPGNAERKPTQKCDVGSGKRRKTILAFLRGHFSKILSDTRA